MEDFFNNLFENDIAKMDHLDCDTYIEFKAENGLKNVKRIIFSDKFYAKERYSIKVFSFEDGGVEQLNFEEEDIALAKKEALVEQKSSSNDLLLYLKKLFELKKITYFNETSQYDTLNYIEI